ncbi:cytochrome c biogenesis protein [Gynurincola endophyticus]|jgi:heme exporter protein C|uniref:cytochrome c biogenesis protein n=1 Tax=Gynurincola endophyticus TaxID=2479004 RepID=UPI000F8F4FB6|nr:cytochrome c biogenesis protein [Gynurincola endophyticus]
MRRNWWKILCVLLLLYTFIGGFLVKLPYETAYLTSNLYETMRNFFFHVPMWFGQMILLFVSLVYAVINLSKNTIESDIKAQAFAQTGTIFGALGLLTGSIWAKHTWGSWWNNDPKQLGVAIAMMIYLAYFILRSAVTDIDKRARISAVYNVFAFFIYIPLIMILPRMVESLHPGGQGSEGNPGLSGSSLDPSLRVIFWPAVLGWTLLGTWITTLWIRIRKIEEKSY